MKTKITDYGYGKYLIYPEINEQFIYKGREFLAIESPNPCNCEECDLYGDRICPNIECDSNNRDDNTDIIIKEILI